MFFLHEGGRRLATPLFLALVAIEVTDVVFAVDSIPAIFAVTDDAFIVFTSNVFALLGMRSLYFALAGLVGQLAYLKAGLAAVLAQAQSRGARSTSRSRASSLPGSGR